MSDLVALQVLPGSEGFFRGDRPRPQPFKLLHDDLRVRGEPESLPGHPIQTDGVAAFPVTRSGETVKIRICRRVGALPRDTEHRPGRGSQEEEVETGRREGLVQRLCASDFRPHSAPKLTIGNLSQELGFGDSGSVYDTAYRRSPVAVPPGEQSPYRVARSDVEGDGIDGDATHLQLANRGDLVAHVRVVGVDVPVAPGRQRSAASQYQTTCTAVRKPAGGQQTECAHASGDEISGVGTTPQRLSHRLAGYWHQGGREEFAVAQRQDGLGWRRQHRGQRGCAITDVDAVRDVHDAAPQLGLFCPDDASESPQTALAQRLGGDGLADAAGDDPQRRPVVVIPLGQPADDISHFRRQTDRAVDVGLSGVHRPGLGQVEDTPCLGDTGRRVASVGEPIAESAGGIALPENRERAGGIARLLWVSMLVPRLPLDRVR